MVTPPSDPPLPILPESQKNLTQYDSLNETVQYLKAEKRSIKRNQLKKQTSCIEQHPKQASTLRHSASLERFPEHFSWLKPSFSMGNIPTQKQRFHGGMGAGVAFSSAESLLEEPEPVEQNSDFCSLKNHSGWH